MAKEFDNSFSRLAHGASLAPLAVLTATVFVFLSVGAGLSVSQGNWPLLAIFVFLAIGAVVFAVQNYIQFRNLAAARTEGRIEWQTANPDVQRQNLNLEVLELSRILDMGTEQLSDLQSAYIVAEDLALRQIQQEEKIPLLRHVSVCGVPFNAVMIKGDVLFCSEVSFLVSPELRQDRVDAMRRKIAAVDAALKEMQIGLRAKLMIVLITQLNTEEESRLRGSLGKRRFPEWPVEIEIRFLDFEALQRIFVTD
jgi:hypothetical protein